MILPISQVDEKTWGSEKCRCIGYDGAPGRTNVSIGGAEVPYPAEAGASCEAWDAKNHPDCLGAWVRNAGKVPENHLKVNCYMYN